MFTTPRLVAIALCAALNFAVGSVVFLLKLPIYLDSIGTILCALLIFPDRLAAVGCSFIAGFISVVLSGLLINPFHPWFTLTVLAIAMVSAFLTANAAKSFRTRLSPQEKKNQPEIRQTASELRAFLQTAAFGGNVVLYGIITGLVSAVVSAPVVVYMFGGITGSGSSFIVAFFLQTGQQLMSAVLLSGLAAEPIDKTLQVLLAALLFRATPQEFITMLRAGQPAAA